MVQFRSRRSYIIRRILETIPLVLAVIIINFILIHVAPGDPISLLAGEFALAPEYESKLRAEFGLDKSLFEQLFIYIKKVLCGDLGESYVARQPVAKLILQRIPNTLLMILPMFFGWAFGIAIGIFVSKKPLSLTDNIISVGALIGYSIPIFWLAQINIILFSIYLGWFPTSGMKSLTVRLTGIGLAFNILYHLILPGLTMGIKSLTLLFRLTRAQMIEVLTKDFVTAAKAKGLHENTIILRHGLRNALAPLLTVMGHSFARAIAGAVLLESVFAWPGVGRLMFNSVLARDYPVLMGIFIYVSITMILVNLFIDILYALVDPRVVYK